MLTSDTITDDQIRTLWLGAELSDRRELKAVCNAALLAPDPIRCLARWICAAEINAAEVRAEP